MDGADDGADDEGVINAGRVAGAHSVERAGDYGDAEVERVGDHSGAEDARRAAAAGGAGAGGAGAYPPCDVASVGAGALSAESFYAAYALRAAPVAVRGAYPVDPLPFGTLLADLGLGLGLGLGTGLGLALTLTLTRQP